MAESLALNWRRIYERYGLKGTVCENCGTAYFPPRNICAKCRRRGKLVDKKFEGKGKVIGFTEITAPPEGFELAAPYVLALIELEEGPKLLAQLVNTKYQDVDFGMQVETVFRKVREDGEEGAIHYGYKFKAARD